MDMLGELYLVLICFFLRAEPFKSTLVQVIGLIGEQILTIRETSGLSSMVVICGIWGQYHEEENHSKSCT